VRAVNNVEIILTTRNLLNHNDLWSNIRKYANKAKRRQVAVAYVGHGAASILPLRRNDVLILDLSETTVRNGQVDPSEVGKFIDRGVRVYRCPGLHAKIYLFDNVVIVGSANLSKHSRDYLVEAAIVSSNKNLLEEAEDFLMSLKKESYEVSKQFVEKLKKFYRPPVHEKKRVAAKPKSALWIIPVTEEKVPDMDKKFISQKEEELKLNIDSSEYSIGYIWGGKRPREKKGDRIIQIFTSYTDNTSVIPPSRVIAVHKGREYWYTFLAEQKKIKKLPWRKFAITMKRAGYKRISKNSYRLVKSSRVEKAIYNLFKL
jgi:hypothetical protein